MRRRVSRLIILGYTPARMSFNVRYQIKIVISEVSKKAILELWARRPVGISYPPASEADLVDFEGIHGKIPDDFRWFLKHCGSGVIGSEWIDGIDDLYSSHSKFHSETQIPNGWKTSELFIIGWDGSGNPIGLMPDGQVVVEDHNFGGVHRLSETLEDFILTGITDKEKSQSEQAVDGNPH